MARILRYSGTQSCTPATDHALQTWNVDAAGGTYVLTVDASALLNGEALLAYVERNVLGGGTRRELFRLPMAAHAGSGIVETVFFGADGTGDDFDTQPEIRVGLRLEGAAARNIVWAIGQVDAVPSTALSGA